MAAPEHRKPALSTDPTPIDLAHLARYTGGEKALNAEILKLFDGQVTDMVGQLNAVLQIRDAKRWREITHTIKGAARGVGAFGMGEAAAAAEPIDPANEAKARAAIDTLQHEADSVRGFIQKYLAAA
jgi:HPt (histidine-containing phosphotransfer) domain-containing protein